MYRDWVLIFLAIICICILCYFIYDLSKKNFEEGFALVKTPLNLYTPQEIKGIIGRYIRILPSLTNGDGFLTLSQVQVFDMYGNNIAPKGTATASSTGGSPLDKKYGSFIMNGSAKISSPGVSEGPASAIDGVLIPKDDLVDIFETSIQNACSTCTECDAPGPTNFGAGGIPYNTKKMTGCDSKARDNQYWELDLGTENLIKGIQYIGRSNPQTDVSPWQGCRAKGMRLIILNSSRMQVYSTRFPTNDKVQNINFPTPVFSNIQVQQSVATDIFIPNIAGYRTWMNELSKNKNTLTLSDYLSYINRPTPNIDSNILHVDVSNSLLPSIFSGAAFSYTNNMNMSAFNSYYDIYSQVQNGLACTPVGACKTTTIPNVDTVQRNITKPTISPIAESPLIAVQVLGTVSAVAANEMTDSINLTQKLNLSIPEFIDYYLRVAYPTARQEESFKPYIRNTHLFCQPELFQKYDAPSASFKNYFSITNQFANSSRCNTPLDPTKLSLLPFAARNFIIHWVYDRSVRYNEHCKIELPVTIKAIPQSLLLLSQSLLLLNDTYSEAAENCNTSTIPKITYIAPQVNITSSTFIDNLGQQFYELMNGNFVMSYIYDVQSIGQTILDVRFDLVVHVDIDAGISGPLADLKAQYERLKANTRLSQDMVDTINVDYTNKLSEAVNNQMQAVSQPIYGVVVRLFYTTKTLPDSSTAIDKNNLNLTGMIFDEKAVTSFIEEMNCGIPVPSGTDPGNVNMVPSIKYTLNKNIVENLDCQNEQVLKRIMNDYVGAVMGNSKILKGKNAIPNVDTTKTSIFIKSIRGATQISPTQCAIAWSEELYDPLTNMAVYIPSTASGGTGGSTLTNIVNRQAVFHYTFDTKNWYVTELTFNTGKNGSNIKFYPTLTIPDCRFDIPTYTLSNSATSTMTDLDVYKYFVLNTLKSGEGAICPSVLPAYSFDASGYIYTNNLQIGTGDTYLSSNTTYAAALQDYKTKLRNGINPIVKNNNSIVLFPTPYTYMKPLPYRSNLDSYNNKCPTTNCEDLDVLYSLAQQYNSDITIPGTIVRITRAFTTSPYQCDIEADISYTGRDLDILSGSLIPKGGIKYSAGSRGLERTSTTTGSSGSGIQSAQKLSMSVQLDRISCTYLLARAGLPGSGTAIQNNTPYLYKNLEYATEFALRYVPAAGSAAKSIANTTTSVVGSTRATLTNYRVNTYAAAADIKDPTATHSVTPSSPPWSAIQNGSVPLTVTPPVVSGFTDYSPLNHPAFGLDRARNSDDSSLKEIQYKPPLDQELPKAETGRPYPTYKYIRFHPIKVRVPSAGVGVNKFSFFFDGNPVIFPTTSVLNRMGTWSGSLKDVTGDGPCLGFYDIEEKPLVFAFYKPMTIDSYSWTTSSEATDSDPISWKLEGSSNGTYWTLLHRQDGYPTPLERLKGLPVFHF